MIRFSFVIPAFNEEAVLPVMIESLLEYLQHEELKGVTEVIFVDDGSRDNTWEIISAQALKDSRFTGVRLSRNFGHQAALTAGYEYARGDAIISMDADLQHPLPVVLEFIAKWKQGFDIVYGVRKVRTGEGFFKRLYSELFYRIINILGGATAPANTADFRLLSRPALDAFRKLPERHRYLRGLVGWIGFKSTTIEYEGMPRAAGETKYSFRMMVRFAADAIVSMSSAPLRFSYYAAIFGSLFFLGYLSYTFVMAVWGGAELVPGWTSLMVTIVIFGVLNLICIGLIGEYVGRIYEEVKRRPIFIVSELVRNKPGADPSS